MKKYLIILLISISFCIKDYEINESEVKIVEDIENDKEIQKDFLYTIFLTILNSRELKNDLKEFFSQYTDDVYIPEVLIEKLKIILDLEELRNMFNLVVENRKEIERLYDYKSIIEILKRDIPNFPWDDVITIYYPEFEEDLILKEDKPKVNGWKIFINVVITVIEVLVPELTPVLEKGREIRNGVLDENGEGGEGGQGGEGGEGGEGGN